ncbi:MAG TPA: YjjG family noncanonical pyrimidine nucleotidase [Bacteroidales bacterium]
MNHTYHHLYFDLDRTLWDYEANASEALLEVYEEFGLQPVFGQFENFWNSFNKYNDALWNQYQKGMLKKEVLRVRRFELALLDYKTNNKELAVTLNNTFLNISPRKPGLVDGANEVLEYLKSKSYHMYILTNGFTQIQEIKMKASGLSPYFEKMFTTENTKSHKPKRAIFEHALKSVHARKAESLMIGDDLEVDILGARNFGMDQVYFNPTKTPHKEKVTYEISNLLELKNIL